VSDLVCLSEIIFQLQLIMMDHFALLCVFLASVLNVQILSDTNCDCFLFYTSALELSFMFLLVWYYCTLTIRESILKVNGSRIKGWWRLHHFISTVVSGVLLIWPNTGAWYEFREQFMWFNVYISKCL